MRQKKEKKENYLVYNKQDIVTQIPELNTDIDAEPQKKKMYSKMCIGVCGNFKEILIVLESLVLT